MPYINIVLIMLVYVVQAVTYIIHFITRTRHTAIKLVQIEMLIWAIKEDFSISRFDIWAKAQPKYDAINRKYNKRNKRVPYD